MNSAGRGLLDHAWRRLRRNRAAIAALAMLGVLVVASLVGPALSQYSIDHVDWTLASLASPPSLENGHWFGTDSNGRDLFVRVWAGTQVSLLVALLATAVSLYYYLNVIRALYLRPSAELQFAAGGQPPRDLLLQTGTAACVVVVIGSFFAVQPLIDLATKAIASL